MADEPVRDFLQDPVTGDIAVVNGDWGQARGQPGAAQLIRISLRTFLGEIFIDQTLGVDWLGSILGKDPNPLVVRTLLKEAILAVYDVVDATGADLVRAADGDPRHYAIAMKAQTVYSASPIEESVTVPGV